jgi:hypothetical protein
MHMNSPNIGDTVYIYIGDHKGKRTAGKVVHAFMLPGWAKGLIHYVIEIETSIDPFLEIRNQGMIWDKK